MLGSNVVVRTGAFLHRAVVHDNVFIGPHANLRGCVVGKNTDIMRAARIEEGAVLGDECVIEEEAIISAGVKVYPFKTIEAGAVIHSSVIWESRGQRSLFGARGVSGIVNVEITPELVVRLTSAYATTLDKGATVVTVAGPLARGPRVQAGGDQRAHVERDQRARPRGVPVAGHPVRDGAGGRSRRDHAAHQRRRPGQRRDPLPRRDGADLPAAAVRKVERIFQRQEFRRAFPGEIGDLSFPPRAVESYVQELRASIDSSRVAEAGLKVVVDTAGGVAALVLPTLLAGCPSTSSPSTTGSTTTSRPRPSPYAAEGLRRLGELVASSRATFGVRFDPVGERLSIVDDTGRPIDDDRALLVFLDLVAAERQTGRVALPVTTTRVAEQVCRFHGVEVLWTTTAPDDLARAAAMPGLILGGDGRGGFVVPEVGHRDRPVRGLRAPARAWWRAPS